MKALIIAARGVQDQEFLYPYYRLQEAGYDVEVGGPAHAVFDGIAGLPIEPTLGITFDLKAEDFELLVIPGGVKAMEKLRLIPAAVQFVAKFHATGKVVASICSGAQMLISAGLVKGRRISAYPAMRVDVENAGGEFVDRVVVDDRIVTAPHYRNLGAWMKAVLEEVARPRQRSGTCAAAL